MLFDFGLLKRFAAQWREAPAVKSGQHPVVRQCDTEQPDTIGASRKTEPPSKPPLSALRRGIWPTCGRFVERRLPESNRCKRLCRPLRNHSAKAPKREQA